MKTITLVVLLLFVSLPYIQPTLVASAPRETTMGNLRLYQNATSTTTSTQDVSATATSTVTYMTSTQLASTGEATSVETARLTQVSDFGISNPFIIDLIGYLFLLIPLLSIGVIYIGARFIQKYFERRYAPFKTNQIYGKSYKRFKLYLDYNEMVNTLQRYSGFMASLGILTFICASSLYFQKMPLHATIGLIISTLIIEGSYYLRKLAQHKQPTTEMMNSYIENRLEPSE